VFVWTVNDSINMSRMMSRGVDGIITDDPALLNRVIEQRAELSAPQRLLLEVAFWMGMVPKNPKAEVDLDSDAAERIDQGNR
jgi:glycerophosphoryl diester phosphodiesterase